MRLSFILLLLSMALNFFTACSDDEVVWMEEPTYPLHPQTATRAAHYTSSLVQEGKYWKATRRVPLVGEGRIVNDVANKLVTLVSGNNGLAHLIDEDLTNCATFGAGLVGADAVAFEIVSIRDLHRTYAPGQKVGFVFKMGSSGLLNLDVLKSFWIQTFKNGKKQENFGNTQGTEVLELDLISVANNDEIKELSFEATKEFDEVQLNVAGISASVLKDLKVYYAFVGDNEIKPATAGSVWFPQAHLHEGFSWTNILNSKHIIDNELNNYAYYGTLSGLLGDPHATVDFGREIPAGSEVGFVISTVDVLNIDALGSIILETYNANDEKVDHVSFTKAVELSLIKVGNRNRISLKTTKPCTQLYINFAGLEVKLGGTNVYYAYARDAEAVDITSRFSASDVTISGTSYTLPSPPGGTTTWQIVDAVEGTMPEIKTFTGEQSKTTVTKIVGMNKNGAYRLIGTFTPTETTGEAAKPVTLEFVITRQGLTVNENCNHVLGTSAGASVADITGGGALISISNASEAGKLVDEDPTNYVKLIGGLGLAKDVGIVAIELNKPIEVPENQKIRVGFTMQNTFEFLGANVLSFFQVRLFHQGGETERGLVNNSEVGDIGLVGGKGNKIRMSIKATKTFDKIELWKVGVVELNLNEWRIYNAFWEKDDETVCPVGDTSEACMEMLTSAQGAKVNYDISGAGGAATVASIFKNMGNLLDDDPNNYALCNATKLIGTEQMAIKFPPLEKGSTIGFVMTKPEGLADIGLLSSTKLEVWSHGAKVNKDYTGKLLNIGLIGHNQRIYVETRVTDVQEFDEVRIAFPEIAGVLETRQIYGVFTRRDTDMDGIPDCAEDEENPKDPVDMLTKAQIENPHICLNESLYLDVTGGKPEETYRVVCWNTSRNNELTEFVQKLTLSEGKQRFILTGLQAGEYFIRIYKGNDVVYASALEAYVHPLQTTWKKNAQTTDWNSWSNWTDGAPWTCTDVILPTGCIRYPELQNNQDPNTKNNCANLHIESHAELVNSHLLDHYDYVWMELTLSSGKNYILSSPLTNTVTGDYFIPAKWQGNHSQEHKFVSLTSTNSPENRFAPRLYQRCWSRDVPGKVLTDGVLGTTVITSETDWTAPFNAVAEPITPGMGWMVRAEDEGLPVSELTFRFPKTHGEYSYFDATGAHTGTYEGVYRNRQTLGQFVINSLPFEVTANNYSAGTTFVVGNPFAAHLNIAKFLQGNQNIISEVKLTNGNGTYTVLYRAGEITTTSPGFTHIAPMQGFYVTAKSEGKQLTVRFTADMQEQMPGYNIYANGDMPAATRTTQSMRTRSAAGGNHDLRILAVCAGQSTQCVVKLQPNSHLDFYGGEDSHLLYDSENPPTAAVFTVAGGVAADIQQVPAAQAQSIDVGWRMEQTRDLTLHFSHAAGNEWSRWVLENRQTGQRISLSQPETMVQLGQQTTRIGGWRLVKE